MKKKVKHVQKYKRFKFMQNSTHYTVLLHWNFSWREFEWHLTFLFLALETDLRKSHSWWWRFCLVLLMQVQEQELQHLLSPLSHLLPGMDTIAICCSQCPFLTTRNGPRYSFPFIYASVYTIVIVQLLGFLRKRLPPPFTLISHNRAVYLEELQSNYRKKIN